MFRFLLWVWNCSDEQQCSVATDLERRVSNSPHAWRQAISAPGLLAFYARKSPLEGICQVLSDDLGVVLGHLFGKSCDGSPSEASVTLTPAQSREVVLSEGRRLISHFWGRYLAVIRNPDGSDVSVIRDPSGTLPCFMTAHQSVHLMFSDIGDYAAMGLRRFSVDWERLSLVAAGVSRSQTEETALVGIQELRAGECVKLGRSAPIRSFCWNPVDFAGGDSMENFSEAAQALRHTVQVCTQAWAGLFSRIVHSLSGGLDSSIVLSALAESPRRPTLTALNLYTRTLEGDERPRAQKAADHMRVPLVKRELDGSSVDLERLGKIGLSPFPDLGCTTELLVGPHERTLAAETGAEALFSGVGGDGVLLQTGAQWATADYIRTRGIRWPLLRVAHDAAQMTSGSVWTLLGSGLLGQGHAGASARSNEPPHSLRPSHPFLSADASEYAGTTGREASRLPYSGADRLPPGKQWHVRASCFSGYYYRPFAALDRPEGIFPLVSQPIRELCLRIPLYVMFQGGLDRAVARAAFATDVPREVIHRTFKGQANQLNRDMLEANLAFVREYLLEGVLVGRNVVDARELERFLRGERPGGMAEIMGCNQIMARLLPVEAFARRWMSEITRV